MSAKARFTARALLFDLDDTLIHEVASAEAALRATAALAHERRGVDPEALSRRVRARAREQWYASPLHPYARRIGISSWEGLWARFEGDAPELVAYRAWSPRYRQEAWRLALADLGVDDPGLAETLAARFPAERRRRHLLFHDSRPLLEPLRAARRFRLALVTNGLSCLQREKIAGGGLAPYFDAIVAAGDVGAAKPDPRIFAAALRALDVPADEALMIGNNPDKDIAGARAAGLRSVWVDRVGAGSAAIEADARIRSLEELPALIRAPA